MRSLLELPLRSIVRRRARRLEVVESVARPRRRVRGVVRRVRPQVRREGLLRDVHSVVNELDRAVADLRGLEPRIIPGAIGAEQRDPRRSVRTHLVELRPEVVALVRRRAHPIEAAMNVLLECAPLPVDDLAKPGCEVPRGLEERVERHRLLEDVPRAVHGHAAAEVVFEHVVVHAPTEGLRPRRTADRRLDVERFAHRAPIAEQRADLGHRRHATKLYVLIVRHHVQDVRLRAGQRRAHHE